jgi:O-antigen/teichoic acid export membrane protein
MLTQRTGQFNGPAIPLWAKLFNGGVLVFCADLVMIPTGLLTVALLTRWLGPEGYGLFALSASLVAGIEWGLASILSRPTIHGVSHATDWRPVARTLLGWHAVLAASVLLIIWMMAKPFAALLGEPALVGYFVLFACDLPFFLLAQAYRNILTGRGQFGARALAGASRWIARLVFIAAAVQMGLSITAAILGSIAASIVELAVGRMALGSVGSPRATDTAALKRVALPLVVSAASMALVGKMDLFLIKLLGMPVEQTGLYAAAQNLSILPGIFGQAVSAVLLAGLTKAQLAGQTAIFQRTSQQSIQACLCLLPVVALVAGAAPGITALCFGPAFTPAAPFVSILMIGAVAQVFIGILAAMLTAAGYMHWTMAIAGPLVFLTLGGHVWSIPRWGALGAAWTTAGALMLGAAASYAVVHYFCSVQLRLGSLLTALLLGALGWGAATVGPTGAGWLLMGLPCTAVILVGLYGWLEGLIDAGWLVNAMRGSQRSVEHLP